MELRKAWSVWRDVRRQPHMLIIGSRWTISAESWILQSGCRDIDRISALAKWRVAMKSLVETALNVYNGICSKEQQQSNASVNVDLYAYMHQTYEKNIEQHDCTYFIIVYYMRPMGQLQRIFRPPHVSVRFSEISLSVIHILWELLSHHYHLTPYVELYNIVREILQLYVHRTPHSTNNVFVFTDSTKEKFIHSA